MIRAVLQRPGRLRMRLTVVAAASALFALIVLAALVLPSLQHNLEQSRVDSLRASVLASDPAQFLNTFRRHSEQSRRCRRIAGTLGAGRVAVFERLRRLSRDRRRLGASLASSPEPGGSCEESAHRSTATSRPSSACPRADGRAHVLHLHEPGHGGRRCSSRRRCATSRSRSRPSSAASSFGGVLAFVVALIAGALAAEPLARRLARLRAAADRIAHGSFAEPIVDHSHDEIGELARSLEEMRMRLEALERSRSAFIANASHELRTPLTALGGYLELLTEGGLTDAERSEFLETMGEQVQRLTKLATDLLDLSRLDAGGITVGKDEIDLGELAADCAREMQPLASRRGSRRSSSRAPIRRSRAATRDACCRCCACSSTTPCATPRRARRSRCCTETTPWGASIIVSDNGPGIAPELLERVFERFFRGPGAAARGIGPRARDRARAGRAHGRPAARHERPRAARASRSSCPGRVEEPAAAYTGSS